MGVHTLSGGVLLQLFHVNLPPPFFLRPEEGARAPNAPPGYAHASSPPWLRYE